MVAIIVSIAITTIRLKAPLIRSRTVEMGSDGAHSTQSRHLEQTAPSFHTQYDFRSSVAGEKAYDTGF
jgi:hypothetical protein